MGNAFVIILGALATLITALGGGSIVVAIARRRPTRVEAVVNLNESTFAWAERIERASAEARAGFAADRDMFRDDLAEARRQAREARDEAADAHRRIRALRTDLTACNTELRTLQEATAALATLAAAIRRPGATVEGLRGQLDAIDLPPGVERQE